MDLCRVRSLRLVVTLVVAAAAVGCGDGTLSSPTAPSALLQSATLEDDVTTQSLASTEDHFVALGGGKNKGGNSGSGKEKDSDSVTVDGESSAPDEKKNDNGKGGKGKADVTVENHEEDEDGEGHHGRRGSLSGFVTAVGSDSITIRGITVNVTETTVIRHGHRLLELADIAIGDHAQAKGAMSADGTTLTATEIKVENTGNDKDHARQAEVQGAVAGLPTGTLPCPALTFTVGTTTVETNSATTFDDVTCATLANGNIVEVEGVRQTDGSILATTVEVQSGPNEVEGKVSGLASTASCPNLTFTVGTTTVTTSSTTVFEGVTCAALANGTRIEAEGTLTGTTLAAAKIELD